MLPFRSTPSSKLSMNTLAKKKKCCRKYITSDTRKRAEKMVGWFLTHRELKEKEMEDLNPNPTPNKESHHLFSSVNSMP